MSEQTVVPNIWERLNEDENFLAQPESVRNAMRPFAEALPTILADKLELPVTLNAIAEAKIAFFQYGLDNGFVSILVTAMPSDMLMFDSLEDNIEMFDGLFRGIISGLTELVQAIPSLFEDHGVSEKDLIVSAQVGLNDEARKLYRKNALTIGKLIEVNPYAIMNNPR